MKYPVLHSPIDKLNILQVLVLSQVEMSKTIFLTFTTNVVAISLVGRFGN